MNPDRQLRILRSKIEGSSEDEIIRDGKSFCSAAKLGTRKESMGNLLKHNRGCYSRDEIGIPSLIDVASDRDYLILNELEDNIRIAEDLVEDLRCKKKSIIAEKLERIKEQIAELEAEREDLEEENAKLSDLLLPPRKSYNASSEVGINFAAKV